MLLYFKKASGVWDLLYLLSTREKSVVLKLIVGFILLHIKASISSSSYKKWTPKHFNINFKILWNSLSIRFVCDYKHCDEQNGFSCVYLLRIHVFTEYKIITLFFQPNTKQQKYILNIMVIFLPITMLTNRYMP